MMAKSPNIRMKIKYFGGPLDGQTGEMESRTIDKNPPDKSKGHYRADPSRSTGDYIAVTWYRGTTK
jgi:hypothetical protein